MEEEGKLFLKAESQSVSTEEMMACEKMGFGKDPSNTCFRHESSTDSTTRGRTDDKQDIDLVSCFFPYISINGKDKKK